MNTIPAPLGALLIALCFIAGGLLETRVQDATTNQPARPLPPVSAQLDAGSIR